MAQVTAATAHQTYHGTATDIPRAETEVAKTQTWTVIIDERCHTIFGFMGGSRRWRDPVLQKVRR
jgi:hypothetical protein